MKLNFIRKPCPACRTLIGIGLFTVRGEIKRCPKCGSLLIENPKNALIAIIIGLSGLILGLMFPDLFGIRIFWGILIIVVSFMVSLMIIGFIVIRKDFIIRNKQTNETSYIDRSDWDEILKNSSGRENNFEIIEEL